MNEESYTDDADVSQLETRIDELEATIRKMLPSRREALGMGVAGLAGASLMSGTASAGSAQVGTIGDPSNLVDVEAEDIDVSDTLTTQDIVVNGTATGPFGGGVVFEDGDPITEHRAHLVEVSANSFETIFDVSPAVDVYGGAVYGVLASRLRVTFGSTNTITLGNSNDSDAGRDTGNDAFTVHPVWPMKNVEKIEFYNDQVGPRDYGYQVFTT